MPTTRREFLAIAGATASTLAGTLAAVRSEAANPPRRKLIIRADDLGYTDVCNMGSFLTMEPRGVVSAADVMLDTPGTVDALKRLRKLPWLSVGWHAHFWGSPLLDPARLPSLVIDDQGRRRFRKDLRTASDVDEGELLRECRAQLDRCRQHLGRVPDTWTSNAPDTPWGRTMAKVCDEHDIAYDFAHRQTIKGDGTMTLSATGPKWSSVNVVIMDAGPAFRDLMTDSVTELEKYDPYKYYAENRGHFDQLAPDAVICQAWHPGWVDYYMYRQGDYGPAARNFIVTRTKDVEALTSDRMRDWIKANRIELVNFRDALHGTDEYQLHLKAIGSDLYAPRWT